MRMLQWSQKSHNETIRTLYEFQTSKGTVCQEYGPEQIPTIW